MFPYRRIVFVCAIILIGVSAVSAPYLYREWYGYRRHQLQERCRDARSHQRWDELQALAGVWSEWDSLNGEAWIFRAQAAIGHENWSDAADDLWKVPESDPRAIQAMIELSKLSFTHLNDPIKGVGACERILRIDPRAAGAQKQLMGFYATTLQRQKLLQQIYAAIDVQSEPREAYVYFFLLNTLRSMSAVDLTQRWLQGAPDEESFLVANVLNLPDLKTESPETPVADSDNRDPLLAMEQSKLELVDKLLKRFPHNIELIAYKTEERFAAGDFSGASALLSQTPETAADDSRFWRFKGWLHESNNEIEDAYTAYHKALELYPVDWNTMNRLAIVERRRQNIAEVERLTKLVEHANEIRQVLKKLDSVESVTPRMLLELAKYYRDCGDRVVGPALERRLGRTSQK